MVLVDYFEAISVVPLLGLVETFVVAVVLGIVAAAVLAVGLENLPTGMLHGSAIPDGKIGSSDQTLQ